MSGDGRLHSGPGLATIRRAVHTLSKSQSRLKMRRLARTPTNACRQQPSVMSGLQRNVGGQWGQRHGSSGSSGALRLLGPAGTSDTPPECQVSLASAARGITINAVSPGFTDTECCVRAWQALSPKRQRSSVNELAAHSNAKRCWCGIWRIAF